jgi:hypothetical protein
MTDTMTSHNIHLSSWDARYTHTHVCVRYIQSEEYTIHRMNLRLYFITRIVSHRPIARQRLSKYIPRQGIRNSRGHPLLGSRYVFYVF